MCCSAQLFKDINIQSETINVVFGIFTGCIDNSMNIEYRICLSKKIDTKELRARGEVETANEDTEANYD